MLRISADKKIGYAAAIIILAAVLPIFLIKAEYIRLAACLLYALAALFIPRLLKKRSILSYNSREVTLITAVFAALYVMLYFLGGLAFGFFKSPTGTVSAGSLLKYVIPIAVIIVSVELLRPVFAAQRSRALDVFACLIGISSEIAASGGVIGVNSSFELTDLVVMTLFPAVTANILYTYLAKRYGALPSILYRLIITLYVYLIPFTTGVPEPMRALVLLLMPLGILLFVDSLYEKKRKVALKKKSAFRFILPTLAILLMSGFVMLITCKFRYGILVIATESMSGEIEVGDAVVYEDYGHYDGLSEGDVIVFEERGRRVVHRVVDITAEGGAYKYTTKGDANEGVDAGFRTDSDVIGVVKFKVAYIGYPTVWLHGIFNK